MNAARFQLETVTATFLHGAAPKERAELRSPPFDGLMRYWFRAAMGPSSALLQIEGRVFGSTDHGRGLVIHLPLPQSYRFNSRSPLLPHRSPNQKPSPSFAVPAQTSFELILHSARPDDAERRLRVGCAALWLGIHLGGVGQRARRGAGSLRMCAEVEGCPPPPRLSSLDALVEDLQQGLCDALHTIREDLAPEPGAPFWDAKAHSELPPFPWLGPAAKVQVVPLSVHGDEEKARAEVMNGLRTYEDPAFGLPLVKKRLFGRHASPLWVHLVRLESRQFAMVQTLLPSSTITARHRADTSKWFQYLESFVHRRCLELPQP